MDGAEACCRLTRCGAVLAAHNDSGLHTIWIWLKWTKFTVTRLYCRLLTKLYRFIIVSGCRVNRSFLQTFTCSRRCCVATDSTDQTAKTPKVKRVATLWSILLDSVIWPILPHIATWKQRSSVWVYYRTLDCLWFYKKKCIVGSGKVSTLQSIPSSKCKSVSPLPLLARSEMKWRQNNEVYATTQHGSEVVLDFPEIKYNFQLVLPFRNTAILF